MAHDLTARQVSGHLYAHSPCPFQSELALLTLYYLDAHNTQVHQPAAERDALRVGQAQHDVLQGSCCVASLLVTY